MFCPNCGTLSFPSPSGDITCTNYKCGYTGPANVKMKVQGKEIDLSKTKTTTKAEKREYDIIKDSDQRKGVLSTESYMCPKCDCTEVYFYLEQTRSSDEPETRMLTCKDCGHGWREYWISNHFQHVVQGSNQLQQLRLRMWNSLPVGSSLQIEL